MALMENFRDFEAGPDPFGRTWHAMFKYLQTGISIRHSDSIDVRYVLDNGEERMQKTVVIQHADLRAFAERTGRKVSDSLCARMAVLKLRHVVETAEDLEKDYLSVTPAEVAEFDARIQKWEADWVRSHAA
jgi:DNA primase large subunit